MESRKPVYDVAGETAQRVKCCVQACGPEFDVPEPVFKRVRVIACPGGAETRCLGLSDQSVEVNSISEFQAE